MNKFFLLFIFLFFQMGGIFTYAKILPPYPQTEEDCSKVDLDWAFGPPRDQKGAAWCYAAVAADLIQFKMNHKLKGKNISMVPVALLRARIQNTTKESDVFGQSQVKQAIQETVKYSLQKQDDGSYNGYCASKDLDHIFLGENLSDASFLYNAILSLKQKYDERKRDEVDAQIQKLFVAHFIQKKLNYQNILSLLKKTKKDRDFPIFFLNQLCRSEKIVLNKDENNFDISEFTFYYSYSDRKSLTGIDEKKMYVFKKVNDLLKLKQPVGLWYKVTILSIDPAVQKPFGGNHISTLIGRRWNGEEKRCEYRIRNSWGTKCELAKPSGELGGYRQQLLPDCKEGQLWLPASDIYQGLTGITYIK